MSVVPTRVSILDGSSSLSSASVHPLESNLHLADSTVSPNAAGKTDAFATELDPSPSLSTVFRHSGWSVGRDAVYAALRRTHQSVARIFAFASCGDDIHVLQSRSDPDRLRLAGSYCHDRLCHPCGNARSRTIAANLIAALPKGRARFLTLTIQHNSEPLVLLLSKLQKSFARLQRTALWKARVTGGAAFLEIKRSSMSDGWHVHYHALLTGKYVPHADLKAAWHAITGDSTVVDIRPAGSRDTTARYVCKYASKPLESSLLREPALLDEAILALRRRRLCQTFGILRGLPLTEVPSDDEWDVLDSLDNLLSREASGDEEALRVLTLLRSDALDDARHCFHSRPPPPSPPPGGVVRQLAFSDLDSEPWSPPDVYYVYSGFPC